MPAKTAARRESPAPALLTSFVALLRGVNVGGKNKLPMADLVEICAAAGARDASTFIQSGSVSINGHKVEALDHTFGATEQLFGRFTLLRRGKKNYAMLNWIRSKF